MTLAKDNETTIRLKESLPRVLLALGVLRGLGMTVGFAKITQRKIKTKLL